MKLSGDAGLLPACSMTSPRKLPGLPERASCISSPFIIMSACGIVPWKLVDSSPSSLAKAKRNWLEPGVALPVAVVAAAGPMGPGRRQQRVEELLGGHRLELHLAEEPLFLLARPSACTLLS